MIPKKKIFFALLFLALNSLLSYGQIFDFRKPDPYKKVFVETDEFGVSYLKQLQDALEEIETDTLKFEVLNDLAYYWHTRNLSTALAFTEKGLALSSERNNLLWQGRFQITQAAILLRQEKLDTAELVLKEARTKVAESDLDIL